MKDEYIESLRAEVERLKAENEQLATIVAQQSQAMRQAREAGASSMLKYIVKDVCACDMFPAVVTTAWRKREEKP